LRAKSPMKRVIEAISRQSKGYSKEEGSVITW